MFVPETFSWDVPLMGADEVLFKYRLTFRWSPEKDYVASGIPAAAKAMCQYEQKKEFRVMGSAELITSTKTTPSDLPIPGTDFPVVEDD